MDAKGENGEVEKGYSKATHLALCTGSGNVGLGMTIRYSVSHVLVFRVGGGRADSRFE